MPDPKLNSNKKTILLISLALIAAFCALILNWQKIALITKSFNISMNKPIGDRNHNLTLEYAFLKEGVGPFLNFSLAIKESDESNNETVLNSIIGNLVKFSENGKIEPYLAKRFDVSSDRLVWTYELRNNLTCDDGTSITAPKYVKQLEKQIKLTSGENPPIDFEHLVGFKDFLSKKKEHIAGLYADGNSIVFKFDKPPEDLNELLRMPYFGFWSDENLSDIGWRPGGKFVSSGPYSVQSKSDLNSIFVHKRSDWFSIQPESPSTIHFYKTSESLMSQNTLKDSATIFETLTITPLSLQYFNELTKIDSAPTLVQTLILNPFIEGPFKRVQNRHALRDAIREKQKIDSTLNPVSFYRDLPSPKMKTNQESLDFDLKPTAFQIAVNGNENYRTKKLATLLSEVSLHRPINFNLVFSPVENPEIWWRNVMNFKTFDARFSGVAAGARPRNFIIKMMFCTDLGIRFPDPSGRICKLVRDQEVRGGPIDESYINEFNQALYDDAAVIPLMHFGTRWYLSRQIDKSSFPPTVESPLFEKIRVN